MTPEQAVENLQDSTAQRVRADELAAECAEEQAEDIRTALLFKVAVAEIVRVTGLTRGRIYQIRDHRR